MVDTTTVDTTTVTKTTTGEKKLTASDIRGVFLRSNLFQGSWNFERMQALGFCFSMVPAIRRLYPENSEERKQAIKRHLEFFNTHLSWPRQFWASPWRWKSREPMVLRSTMLQLTALKWV